MGFRLGSYRNGDLSVLEPTACLNITSSMKAIAKVHGLKPCQFDVINITVDYSQFQFPDILYVRRSVKLP